MKSIPSSHAQRFPSIDGLRAIAVSWVIVRHLTISNSLGGHAPSIAKWVGDGGMGVDIFFVISGFLITSLLLRERALTGSVHIPTFIYRRAVRILPAFWTYLLVVYALAEADVLVFPDRGFFWSLVFLSNYHFRELGWALTHTWSLSIEEQFYVVWPVCLAFLSRQRAWVFCVGALLLEPVLRLLTELIWHPGVRINQLATHLRADFLIAGCALALVWEEHWFTRACAPLFRWRLPLLAAIYLLAAAEPMSQLMGGMFGLRFGYTINALLIAFVLAWVVREPRTWTGRILNSAPMAFLGSCSYGIYLWQQLFTTYDVNRTWTRLPWNLAFILAAAVTSRYLIEKPLLALRDRGAKPLSA